VGHRRLTGIVDPIDGHETDAIAGLDEKLRRAQHIEWPYARSAHDLPAAR
jgi:hypothetical protein